MSEAKWNQIQGGYNDHKMVRESSVTFDNGKCRLRVFFFFFRSKNDEQTSVLLFDF